MAGGTGAAAVTAHVSGCRRGGGCARGGSCPCERPSMRAGRTRRAARVLTIGPGLPREFVSVLRPRGRPARRLDSSRASDTVKACALSSFASSQRRPSSWPSAAVCPFPPTAPRPTPGPQRADARSPRPGPRRCCCPLRGRRASGWWTWRPHGERRSGTRRRGRGGPCPGTPDRGTERNGGPWGGRCRSPLAPLRRGRTRRRRRCVRCRGSGITWRRRRAHTGGRRGPARRSTPAWCAGWPPAASGRTCCGCVIGRTDAEACGGRLLNDAFWQGDPAADVSPGGQGEPTGTEFGPTTARGQGRWKEAPAPQPYPTPPLHSQLPPPHSNAISAPIDRPRAAATTRAAAAASCTATPTDL